MSDKNVCPYCGWEIVEIVGTAYRGSGRGRCPNCQSNGPEVSPPSAAIHAFCHPAHLHEYDPETQVVIKREDILKIYDGNCGDCMIGRRKCPPCDRCCMAAIRTAALEATHEAHA